ncbi:lysophospholipid acyltransferase family protein [Falsiroseomonas sp. HW251]|uniref:lysophospholipid acyltransferase family protein n=1 Tax=Falsiroseomonas sp. HW251 TaxID=3390998 RepID=UPI003D32087D
MRKLIRHPAVQAGLARILGGYIGLVAWTTRWQLVGAAPGIEAIRAGRPLVIAFWHERLPLIPALFRLAIAEEPAVARLTPHVLVSRHRDGRFIGNAVERFGVRMVYGSSSRGGAAALASLLRVLRGGDPVLITPDGPRGPRRVAAPGVAQLAAASGALVLPVGAASSAHRILSSWDRMMLPLPFGRGAIVCGPLIAVPRDGAEAALPAIAAALDAACAEAEAAVGIRR